MKTLDIEAVQAFVLTAELKSFTRAGEALDMTQSAVSLKIRRLEESLGQRLLERTPRQVRLSSSGEVFLDRARALVAAHQQALAVLRVDAVRLVVGLSHHIVGPELPLLLKRMAHAEPGVVLEVRVASSRDLLAALDAGELDAALVLQHDRSRADGEAVYEEHFGWMASADYAQIDGAPLRLATQAAPCSVRAMAVKTLDDAGIVWSESFIGGGVATIGAAVSAGLAVAALGRRVAPMDAVDVGPRLGLPELPRRWVMLYTRLTDADGRRALRTLAAAIKRR